MIDVVVHAVVESLAWLVPDWLAAWWRPWVWVPVGAILIITGFLFWPEKLPAIFAWIVGGLAVFYGVLAEVKQLESH